MEPSAELVRQSVGAAHGPSVEVVDARLCPGPGRVPLARRAEAGAQDVEPGDAPVGVDVEVHLLLDELPDGVGVGAELVAGRGAVGHPLDEDLPDLDGVRVAEPVCVLGDDLGGAGDCPRPARDEVPEGGVASQEVEHATEIAGSNGCDELPGRGACSVGAAGRGRREAWLGPPAWYAICVSPCWLVQGAR